MSSLLQISQLLSVIQPAVGLVVTVMGIILIRRGADPGVKVLTAWGVFWILASLWGMYTESLFKATVPSTPSDWMNVVSGVLTVGGYLGRLATALYALWRFWQAQIGERKR